MVRQSDDTPPNPADISLLTRSWQGEDLRGDDFQRYVDLTKQDFGTEMFAAVNTPWGIARARELAQAFFETAHGMFGRKKELELGASLIGGEPVIYWIAQIIHSTQKVRVSATTGNPHTSVRHDLEGISLHDAHSHKLLAPLDPKHLPGGFGHSWGVVWGRPEPGEVVVIANPAHGSAACTSVLSRAQSESTHAHWTTPS